MNTLAISPDESLVGFGAQRTLTLVTTENGRVTVVECPAPILALAAADGEVWAVCGEKTLRVHRFDAAGNEAGEALELGPLGARAPRFSASVVGRFGAVLLTEAPVSLRPDCGVLDAETLVPHPDHAAPIGESEWLILRDGKLSIADADGMRPLEAAPAIANHQRIDQVATLPDTDDLAITIGGDDPCLWIIDRRRGEVRRRVMTPGAEQTRFAAERGHALALSDSGKTLTIYDLRFGKPVASHANPLALEDIMVGDLGQNVVALRRGEVGCEVVTLSYRSLLRSRKALPWKTPGAVEPTAKPPRSSGHASAPAVAETNATVVAGDNDSGALPLAASGGAPDAALAAMPALAPSFSPALVDHDAELALEPPAFPPALAALRPRALPPLARDQLALRMLERHLALVAAWLQRSIAEGWDSGRIGFATSGAFPFENEVQALLGSSSGRAPEKLASASDEARGIEADHDAVLARDRAACASGEAEHAITPLAALCHEFGLSRLACDILLVVAAPAVWGELARLYGICSNDEDRPLCDEWLVAQILGRGRGGRRDIAAELEPTAPLTACGLISTGKGRRPFASLAVHPLVIRRLYGDDFASDPGDDLVRPSTIDKPWSSLLYQADLPGLFRALQAPHASARVVIRGKRGSGRRTLAAALGDACERRVALIDFARAVSDDVLLESLRRCVLRGWLPCIDNLEALADSDPQRLRAARQALDAHVGPLLFRASAQSTPPVAQGYLEVELDDLPESTRGIAWRRALDACGLSTACAPRFAALYTFGPGIIERVVTRAKLARGAGRPVDRVDVVRALEDGIRQVRGEGTKLAQRVERLPSWSKICLPDELLDSVREFVARVRHRRTVFDQWGFDRVMTSSRGITALFEGRPGTGKTMVAGAIARELGCDLYRVDLSSVLSKWIGETEKHLAEVFDAAEGGQMILLFDEADSLFAKRTEVKSSNDRFANIEVNYLLQRLDSFTGIAILTTNFGRSIDPAFKRRLSLRLTFPFPDEDMRERLWRAHLPPELPTTGALELGELARRYKLSGGYIRNIVLRSAFLAAHEGRPLTQDHLERAVSLEYRATGKLSEGGLLE